MSLKMKLVSMISAFVLVIGMLLIGVFAVERVQVDMGGSITFNADDVYARVTGSVTKAQVEPEVLDVTYSAYETIGNPTAWESLDLEFDSYATPIVISITVENLSTERSLTVNLTDALTSSVPNLGKALQRDSGAYTSGTNIPLDPNGNDTDTTTFTITLSVTDKNQSLTNAQFDYDLNLYDESAVPEPPEVYDLSGFEFNFLENNTVEIAKYNGTASEVVIPATFSIGTITITSFTMNEDGSSDVGEFAMYALYFGGFYYTPQGGERTYCANFMEFASIADTLAFPIYFEPQYTLSLDSYNENSLQLFVNYIEMLAGMQGEGLSDGKFYFTTADGQYNNTLVNVLDLMNSLSSMQDPTELQPMFPMQLNLASPFETSAYIEGDDYTVVGIADGVYDILHISSSTGVFAKNTTITSVVLPDTIEHIGECAFFYCEGLTSITLPSSLTSIGDRAFQNCSNLQPSIADQGVKYLGSEQNPYLVLWDGTGITNSSYTVNRNCKVIYSFAFYACRNLTSITLPSSLTNIGEVAFSGCSNLQPSITDQGVKYLGSEQNPYLVLWDGTGITNSSYTVNPDCKIICPSAFSGCDVLTSITLPEGITSIGDDAFSICTGLTSIDLSNCTSLTSIGTEAFYNCTSLTSITLPEGLTSIGRSAFEGCSSLTSITLPEGFTSVGYNAFSGCVITEVIIDSGDVYTDATSTSACSYLLYYATTVKVLTSLVQENHAYINSTNFQNVTIEGDYTVYRKQ